MSIRHKTCIHTNCTYIHTYAYIHSYALGGLHDIYILHSFGFTTFFPIAPEKNSRADFHATNRHRGDSFPGFHARTGAHQAAAAKNKIHNESVFDWKNCSKLPESSESAVWNSFYSMKVRFYTDVHVESTEAAHANLHAISALEANDAHLHRDLFADVPGDFQCWFLIHHVRWVLIHQKVKPLWKSLEKHSFSNKTPLIECINFIYNQGSCESSGDFERCSSLTSNSAEIYMFQDSSQDAV